MSKKIAGLYIAIIISFAGSSQNFSGNNHKTNNIQITAEGFIPEYYSVPLDQATINILAAIENNSNSPIQNIIANVISNDGYSDTKTINEPIPEETSQLISFKNYQASTTGLKTLIYNSNYNNQNSSDTANITIHKSDLIRDNGNINGAFSISYHGGGYLGNVFSINSKDTLTSVVVYLKKPTQEGNLSVHILNMIDNMPHEKIGESDSISTTYGEGEYLVLMPNNGLILEPGKYVFAVKEGNQSLRLATTTTPYTPESGWIYVTEWHKSEDLGLYHTFYIRPKFSNTGSEIDVSLVNFELPDKALTNSPIEIKGILKNEGKQIIQSVDISWSLGDSTYRQKFNNLNLAPNQTYNFVHSDKLIASNSNLYEIALKVNNPNNSEDIAPINNKLSKNIFIVSEIIPKIQLFEHFTSSTCSPCASFTPTADLLFTNNPGKYSLIRYQVNWPGNGDPYYIQETDTRKTYYQVASVPHLIRNGKSDMDVSQTTFDSYSKEISFIKINIDAHYHEKNIEVSTQITSLKAIEGNYTLHIAIVENTTSGNIGTNGEFEFHNVLMAMLPDADGTLLINSLKMNP